MLKNYSKIIPFFSQNFSLFLVSFWTIFFLILAVLYRTTNSLQVYDGPGHVNLIWYLKTYLWPDFIGWNPFNLLGFEQGATYPPLFHYLAATLSFILGIRLATEFLIGLSLVSLPLSIYFFSKSLTTDKLMKAFISSLLLTVVLLAPGYLGSSLKALTQIGLLTSFVSLPLVFFYLGSLPYLEKGKIFWPTIILVAIVLTHLVAGLFTLLILTITLVFSFKTKNIKALLQHVLWSFLISSFFAIPFLLNYPSLSTSGHVNSLSWPNLLGLLLSATFLITFLKKKNLLLVQLSLASLVLSSMALLDNFVEKVYSSGFLFERLFNLHLYRFQIYEFILITALAGAFSVVYLKRAEKFIKPVCCLMLLLLPSFLFLRSPFFPSDSVTPNPLPSEGRFLEIFSRSSVYPLVYTVQENLVQTTQSAWAYGLFTDATKNGPYLGSLIKSLNPQALPSSTNLIEDKKVDSGKASSLLKLLAINNILYLDGTQGHIASLKTLEGKRLVGSQTLNSEELVEIPKIPLFSVSEGWEKRVEAWWESPGELSNILIRDPGKSLAHSSEVKQGSVSVTSHNSNWTKFEVNVKSEQPVPVLVKFGYNRDWKALSQGKELKIYEASPALMLVVGNGNISFTYQESSWVYLLVCLSLGSLVYFIYLNRKSLL